MDKHQLIRQWLTEGYGGRKNNISKEHKNMEQQRYERNDKHPDVIGG